MNRPPLYIALSAALLLLLPMASVVAADNDGEGKASNAPPDFAIFSPIDGSPAQEKCPEDGGKGCARFPYYEVTDEDREVMSTEMVESLESWARIQKRRQAKHDRGEFPYFKPSEEEVASWMTDVDLVVDDMFFRMSEEELEELWAMDEDARLDYHLSLGTWVRNQYGLWRGNDDLLRSVCGGAVCHPDRASAVIIEKFWDKVHAHEPQ